MKKYFLFVFVILIINNTLIYSKTNKEEQDSFYINLTIGYPFVYGLSKDLYHYYEIDKKYLRNYYSDISILWTVNDNFLLGTGLSGLSPVYSDHKNSFELVSLFNIISIYYLKSAVEESTFFKLEINPLSVFTIKQENFDEKDGGGLSLKVGLGYLYHIDQAPIDFYMGIDNLFFVPVYEKINWKIYVLYGYFGFRW